MVREASGKVYQLYNTLRQQITAGKYNPGDKLPSIRDLAEEFSLSRNTVNTAIAMLTSEGLVNIRNGNGTYVSQGQTTARMIGVIMFDFGIGFRVENMILQYVQKALPKDYYVSLVNHSERYDLFCEGLEHLLAAGAEGLLIVPPKGKPESAEELSRIAHILEGIPAVCINRGLPGIELDTYSMDLKKGMEKALDYLHHSNKTKTVIVLHDSPKFANEEIDAYSEYLEHYNLIPDKRRVIEWNDDIAVIRQRFSALNGDYDSIIAPDNVMIQINDLIQSTGKKIPSELSLVGINDTFLSTMHNPPLTSVAFPVEKIGRSAVQKLISRIETQEKSPVIVRNFAPEMFIRNT